MRELKDILDGEEYEIFLQKGYLDPCYWIEKVFDWKLKPFQRKWINLIRSGNRFINLTAFRGSGKTSLLAIAYPLWISWYHPGKEILVVSSAYKQALRIMSLIKERIGMNELLLELKPIDRNETWKADEIITKTRVKIYSRAYNENIAGVRTDYVIIDESAKCTPSEIFHRIIEPTVDMRKGIVVGITTPENPVDLRAELELNPVYISDTIPLVVDGESVWPEKYPMKEVHLIRRRLGDHAFQSEYMCNPQAQAENALYPTDLIADCFDTTMKFSSKKLSKDEVKGYRVLAGDFAVASGPRADFDAYTVVEKLDGKVYIIHGERHKGFPKNAKVRRLKELYKQFNCSNIIVDPNGIGDAVMRDLKADGLPVTGQEFHSAARSKLLMALRVSMDEGELIIPRHPEDSLTLTYTNVLVNELLGFKESTSEKTGNRSYPSTAPHDDTAISLAMAVKACASQRPFMDFVGI